MPKFRGCAVFRTRVIQQKLSLKIIVFSMETPCSFKAATFSLTCFFFPPSCFSLFFSVCSFSCLSHFATPPSRKKTSSKRILSPLLAQCEFHEEANGTKLSKRCWLSYLRTQLHVFVGGVCLQSKKNQFSAVFSERFFSEETSQREFV